MNFLGALKLAVYAIREERELDEIYLYETSTQTQVYLKNCEGVLEFTRDESLSEQIYLASCLNKRLQSTSLSLAVIFSESWEVRLRKSQFLKVTKEGFLDYTTVGKE